MKYELKWVVVTGFENHKEWFRLCMPEVSLLSSTGRGSWGTAESRNRSVRRKGGAPEEGSTLDLKTGKSCMSVMTSSCLIRH